MMIHPHNKLLKNFISQAALIRFAKKCGFKWVIVSSFLTSTTKRHSLSTPQQDMNPLTQRVLRSYANLRDVSRGLIDEQLERVAQDD